MTTATQDALQESLTPSSAMLLTEHERISSLCRLNIEMGDKYVATYLTVVSAMIALLIAVGQLGSSPDTLIPIETTVMLLILVIGTVTFVRLVERRARGIEYLRAINRIHCYFAEKDSEMRHYLYWPPYDDYPSVHAKGTILGGLGILVGLLNSIAFGLAAGVTTRLWWPVLTFFGATLVGVGGSAFSWYVHRTFSHYILSRAEEDMDKRSRFPQLPPETLSS